MSKAINPAHRYLVRRNVDQKYVGSTNDLGSTLPTAHCLIDAIGEDGLGPGIKQYLAQGPSA